MSDDDSEKKPGLSRGRVWLWHPHVWLTLLIVLVVILIFIKMAS